jgi:hypothetical protein
MKRLSFFLLIAASVLVLCTPLFGADKEEQTIGSGGSGEKEEQTIDSGGYVAKNSRHQQQLGGKSKNASKGLSNAAQHSDAIQAGSESGKGSK